mgnify:CR=1 FL=1
MKRCSFSGYCFHNRGNTVYVCILGCGFSASQRWNPKKEIFPCFYIAEFNRFNHIKTISISFSTRPRDLILKLMSDNDHFKITKSGLLKCFRNYLKYSENVPSPERVNKFILTIKKA